MIDASYQNAAELVVDSDASRCTAASYDVAIFGRSVRFAVPGVVSVAAQLVGCSGLWRARAPLPNPVKSVL